MESLEPSAGPAGEINSLALTDSGVLVTGELGDASAYAERLGRHDSSVVCPTVRNIADAAGATALTVLSAS